MTKVCLLTCTLLNEELCAVWNEMGRVLKGRGIELVVFGLSGSPSLHVPFVKIPYSLKEFVSVGKEVRLQCGDEDLIAHACAFEGVSSGDAMMREGYAGCLQAWESLIADLVPSCVVTWGSSFPVSLIQQRVCQSHRIPVYVIERGLLPGSLMLDSFGHGALSDVLTNLATRRAILRGDSPDVYEETKRFVLGHPGKYTQAGGGDVNDLRRSLGLQNERVVLFLGHQDRFTGTLPITSIVGRRHSNGYPDIRSALRGLLTAAEVLAGTVVVLKPHPHDQNDYDELSSLGLRITRDVTLRTSLELADVVVAQWTTAQFEALFYEKPILLLGRSQLSGTGTAYECDDDGSLLDVLRDALERRAYEQKSAKARSFINGLLEHYLIGYEPQLPAATGLEDLAQFIDTVGSGLGLPDATAVRDRAEESIHKYLRGGRDVTRYPMIDVGRARMTVKKEELVAANELVARASSLHAEGHLSTARQMLESIAHRMPFHAEAQNELASVLYDAGEKEEAKRSLERAINHLPADLTLLRNHVDLCFETGDAEGVRDSCFRILRVIPDDVDAYFALGSSMVTLRLYARAADYFGRVKRLKADYPQIDEVLESLCRLTEPATHSA